MNARVKELFAELADLPPEARTRYFAEHELDLETRREVEELLAFDSGASAFLMHDVSVAASRALPQLDPKGWRCGPYRLQEVIGRGGMGAVYLAERADGEVTQRVAVKLLPPGAGDAQHERFLQERQILASLTHPNIARMLDAGHVQNGQPFLAMEYVEGAPIDIFTVGLSLLQKITLFLKVCAAVGYLHRNLVVHRDLKPSNILVAADGEPKLLDFGIAKILDLSPDSTVTMVRMLTPDYASPEQAAGHRVTTATDIYSLGLVLYKLLTGKAAHEFEEKSLEGIALAINTREVTRPSQWAPELKGDLEAVLLKSLRKDPQERYATVEQFADDLQAFLESRTVRARSGNAWYRTRKFVRRYWVPVSAAALVIASLAAGLYVANRERVIAQRRFQDVRELSNKLFDIDAQIRQIPGTTNARQLIVNTSLEYLRRLRADVRGDPELAVDVANAYLKVAGVEGLSTSQPDLGQVDQADMNLRIAEDLVQSVVQSHPANRAAMLTAAEIAVARTEIAFSRTHYDEALTLARKSAQWLDKFNANASDKPEARAILLTYMHIANVYVATEELDEALKLCQRANDLALLFGKPLERAELLEFVTQSLRYQGKLDEALKVARESLQIQDPGNVELGYVTAMNLVLTLAREGALLGEQDGVSLGHTGEAVQVLERGFKIADRFVHKDPNDESARSHLFWAGGPLADMLRGSEPARALEIYNHMLRDIGEVSSEYLRVQEIDVLAGSSYALRRLGRPAEARQRLDRAFAILKDLKLYPAEKIEPGAEVDVALAAFADHEADAGDFARGIEIYQGVLDRALGAKPQASLVNAVRLSNIYRSMAAIYLRARQAELASAMQQKRLELWRQWDRKLPNNPFVLRQISAAASH